MPTPPQPLPLPLPTMPVAQAPRFPPHQPEPPQLQAPQTSSPDQAAQPPRRRYTGLILLVAAGSAALAAGVVWGIATAPKQNPSSQTPGPVVAVATFDGAQRAAYQATNAKASAAGTSVNVTWSAPQQSVGVQSYIVIVTLHNQTVQTTTVAASTLSAAFAGLTPATTYCVSVVTYAVAPGDQSPHVATPDQCALVTTDPAAGSTTAPPAATSAPGSAA